MSTSTSSADVFKAKVYAAEDEIAPILKRGGPIEHFGSTLIAPAERVFGRVEDVQGYVDTVLAFTPVAQRFERASLPVTVRTRKGHTHAHYEHATWEKGPVIAVPDTAFGLRETTVLHEIAHHLDPRNRDSRAHGASFTETLVALFELVIGPEAAHLLRTAYATHGVPIGADSGAVTAAEHEARAPKDEVTLLDKISKVLHQAENASTEEEADAYFKRAQMLATRYSIDLAVARQHTAKKHKREEPEHRSFTVGRARKRGNVQMVNLFHAIASNNDVRINIAHDSTTVYPFGFGSDLDVCEALFAHLSIQMVSEANRFLKSGAHLDDVRTRLVKRAKWVPFHSCFDCALCSPRDTDGVWSRYAGCESCATCQAEYPCDGENWASGWDCGNSLYRRGHGYGHWDRKEEYETKPPSGQTARIAFYDAFVNRISMRLFEARREAEQAAETAHEQQLAAMAEERDFLRAGQATGELSQAETERLAELDRVLDTPMSSSTSLVLASKRDEVAAYYAANSNARGHWTGSKRQKTSSVPSARRAGDAAGRAARLSGTQALPGARKAVG